MSRITDRYKWRLAQILFWFYRLRGLPRSERIFRGAAPGTILGSRLFGFTFYGDVARGSPQRLIYLEGERFLPEADLIRTLLKPGFRVIDVGANIGYYSLLFARETGESGSIVSIEPSPENLRELHLNVKRNSLSERIKILEAAVGDRTATVGLMPGINSGVTNGDDSAYQVPLDLIDNLVVGPVDFIKMDIEGFEIFALNGATRILKQYQPNLFVEIHPRHLKALGASSAQVIDSLRQYYDNIEIYAQCLGGNLLNGFLRLYCGINQVKMVHDPSLYVSRVDQDETAVPFWAICRSTRSIAAPNDTLT